MPNILLDKLIVEARPEKCAALLHDDLLISITMVLEQGEAPGPFFAFALRTLLEACVLHDVVYYNPGRQFISRGDSASLIEGSRLVQELDGVLVQMEDRALIEEQLRQQGCSYDFVEFISDFGWYPSSFVARSKYEAENLRVFADLLTETPAIFHSRDLVDENQTPTDGPARELFRRGFPVDQLLLVEGQIRKCDAMVALGRRLGLAVYPPLMGIPPHLAAIWKTNIESRARYECSDLMDDACHGECVGSPAFRTVSVPQMMSGLASRSSPNSFSVAAAICELREDHTHLRYAPEKGSPGSAAERCEHDWNQNSKDHRLGYTVWDVRETPSKPKQIREHAWSIPAFWLDSLTEPLVGWVDLGQADLAFEATGSLASAVSSYLIGPFWRGYATPVSD